MSIEKFTIISSPESKSENADIAFLLKRELSPEIQKSILERDSFTCQICGLADDDARDKDKVSDIIEVHRITPIEKDGEDSVRNGISLCKDCLATIHKVAEMPPRSNERFTKAQKRKLWKERGVQCEICGLKLATGGKHLAIHPFRAADWDGQMKNVQTLCAHCLGHEAKKRDKIEKLAEQLRSLE